MFVQRNQKQIQLLQLLQHRTAVAEIRYGIANLRMQLGKDGGLEQKENTSGDSLLTTS